MLSSVLADLIVWSPFDTLGVCWLVNALILASVTWEEETSTEEKPPLG